jgi:hypothetical protein
MLFVRHIWCLVLLAVGREGKSSGRVITWKRVDWSPERGPSGSNTLVLPMPMKTGIRVDPEAIIQGLISQRQRNIASIHCGISTCLPSGSEARMNIPISNTHYRKTKDFEAWQDNWPQVGSGLRPGESCSSLD